MTKRIKVLLMNPLFSGSLVMVIGTNIANFLAYIYHLVFGRILGPSLYSELAVVVSLTGLFFAMLSFFSLVTMKFVASGNEKQNKILYTLLNKKYVIPVGILSFLVLVATPYLSEKLNISISVLMWMGPTVLFMYLYMIHAAFIQGKLRFKEAVSLNIIGILVRLFLGLFLYYLGFSLTGIVAGIMLSYVIVWVLGKRMLGYHTVKEKIKSSALTKNVLRYSVPVFVTTLSLSAFIAVDIVLVKYYFDPHVSGLYASLSTLGKIIFYGAIPVTFVMFPLVSKKAGKNESTIKLFVMSFIITLSIALGILAIFALFPNAVIGMLFGNEYLEVSSLLAFFGIFSLLYVLDYMIVNYYLSAGKTKAAYFVPFGVIAQIVGIVLLHDSIEGVITASIIATGILFIALGIYGLATSHYLRRNIKQVVTK